MSKKIRVGLIFGGKSSEHEVSLASAQSVARALDREKYAVVLIGITKEGRWLAGDQVLKQLAAASPTPLLQDLSSVDSTSRESSVSSIDLIPREKNGNTSLSPLAQIDVAFPLLHGPLGEDGTVQGLLELADLPYVGAGVAASAVGMDKALMKAIFRAHDLPLADWIVILRREWEANPEETIRRVESAFGYPCFVKPANLGSSVGVTKAHNWDELTQALATAAQFDRKIIAERAVEGREIECSVLGNDEPIASVPGEIIPKREFYDYAAKYGEDAGTELIVPAVLPPGIAQKAQELAIRAFHAIDGSAMARVDFFLENSSNKLILNEINTIPGFTAMSMYPRMWQASGIAYPDLIDRLIDLALKRHAEKKK
ncbi:MAG: D-alanine--D-alanine ligase [Chloroflexi bacterium]|nr:D-alanine--D-alanine ligase [Chloroflexota bacterium]